MIKESDMIKASDLKVGDKICSVNGIEYEVIENHVGDVLFLFIFNENGRGLHVYNGLHLFYDEDVECAKNTFGIDLLGWYMMIKVSDLKVGDTFLTKRCGICTVIEYVSYVEVYVKLGYM